MMIGVHLSISDLRWARNASGRAVLGRHRLGARGGQTVLHLGVPSAASCRAADSTSITGFGVPLGAHIPEPNGNLEARQARFSGGWQIWEHCETLLGRRRVGPDHSAC